jgi:hypothetical protein
VILGDALSLPMVAYRGLWDKCAAPLTAEAICRAYSRRVPSLIRCADEEDALRALDVLASVEINRALQPILFVVSESPTVALPHVPSDFPAPLLAIAGSAPFDRAYPISQWLDGAWTPIGSYLPLAASLRGLTVADVTVAGREHAVIMFESTNVADDARLSPLPETLNDDAVYASVRSLAGATAEILRVSDLVELDWLRQRVREAA